jgi:CBS domain-containing protein
VLVLPLQLGFPVTELKGETVQKRTEPQIRDYMSPVSNCVPADLSVGEALQMMEGAKARYLPVLSGGRVIGILNQSAARMAAQLLGGDEFTAGYVMTLNPHVARPSTSLYEVLDDTPSNVYGCTVIQGANGKVIGMFTPKEAMTAVHSLAEQGRRNRRRSAA